MKNFLQPLKILLLGAFLLIAPNAFATHLLGGEITWDCLGTGEVRFTVRLYQNCSGSQILDGTNTINLGVHNHPTISNITLTKQSTTNISPVCAGGSGPQCVPPPNQANSDPGAIEEFVYVSDPINLGNFTPPSQGWWFTYDSFARSGSIQNIGAAGAGNCNATTVGGSGMTLRSAMFAYSGSDTSPCFDSSPRFSERPTAVVCNGAVQTYNHNGSDPDLDSLSFKWAEALDDFTGTFNPSANNPPVLCYKTGYSYDNPLPQAGTNSINSFTGEITYNPGGFQGEFVTVVKVESWRDGEKIAEVYREMLVVLLPCAGGGAGPAVTPPFESGTSFNDTVVAGDVVQFTLTGIQSGAGVNVTASGTQFSSNYANPNSCGNPPCALLAPPPVSGFFQNDSAFVIFYWQTDCSNLNDGTNYANQATFIYVITHQDDACPTPKTTVSTIAITVVAKDPAPAPDARCTSVNPVTGDVAIFWEAATDTAGVFDEYQIFSSTSPSGPFSKVGAVSNINTTVYNHVGANADQQRLYYYVTTKSTCSAENATPSDTLSTIFLQSSQVGTNIQLDWNAVSDPLLSSSSTQYKIYKEYPMGVWNLVDSTTNTTWSEPTTSCTDSINYLIQIEDDLTCTSVSNYGGLSFANPSPSPAFSFTTPCENDFIDFTDNSTIASGSIVGWQWDFGDAQSSTAQNPSHIYGASGSYNVKLVVTSDLGCMDSLTQVLNTVAGPSADAGTDTQICPGDSVQLSASGGTTYIWTPATGLSNASISNPKASPAGTTDYVVEVNNGSGCAAFDTVQVAVTSLPVADAGNDTSVCIGSSVTLTATGGTGYAWSSGDNTASTSVNPVVQTTYYVTVTDANTCTNTDSVVVTINSLPTADAGSGQIICNGDSVQIGGSPTGPVGSSYAWSNGGTLSNASVGNPMAGPAATTSYTVTITDSNGCTDTDAATVTVNNLPSVDAGSNVSICPGDSTQLAASGALDYVWSNGASLTDNMIGNPLAFPAATTTYTVTGTDGNNCSNTDDVTVTLLPPPTPNAGEGISICIGDTATLTATGGVGYAWSTGANTQSIEVSPAVTTTYIVTVTGANSCEATDSVTVTVNPLPTVDAGSDTTICNGETVTLGGSPTGPVGSTFTWSPAASLDDEEVANPAASPSSTTQYIVTVEDANTCQNVDTVTVNVNALPPADAGPNRTICLNDSAQLNASGGTSYVWTPAGTLSDANIDNPKASPATTTVYVVSVTDGNLCSQVDSMTVTVNDLPPADAGNDQDICIGGSATLTATGGTAYSWNTGGNTASIGVTPLVTTTYTVTVTDANLCTATDDVTVNVNMLPTVDAGADTSICLGDGAVLGGSPTGPGGSMYAWSTGGSLNSNSIANPTATPTVTSKYYVTVTDGNTCVDVDSVTVTVLSLPPADAGPNRTICVGDSAQLNASGGLAYAWTPAATLSDAGIADPKASPAATTVYTVSVTDGNTCSQIDSMTVTVNPLPPADAGLDTAICIGGTANLTATGGTGYAWNTGAGTASISVSPLVTTTYTVTVTDGNSCTAIDSVEVTVNPLPTVDAGPTQTICDGDTVQIGGSPTGPVGSTYSWSSGASLDDASASNPLAFPTSTTEYFVTVIDVNTCENIDSVTVNVNTLPPADAGPNRTICLNDSAQLNASGGINYVWSPSATLSNANIEDPKASPAATTVYTVTVTDGNSCTQIDSMTVTVNPLPPANAGLDTAICIGGTANLTATGGTGYAWNTGAGTASISVSPLVTTTYTVTVTDGNSCTAIDSVEVTVNPLPTVDAGPTQTICDGDTVQIGGSPTGPVGSTYSWSSGASLDDASASNPLAFPTSTTEYFVTVIDVNTCENIDSVTVNVNTLPPADAGPNRTICLNDSAQLNASGGINYVWSPSATLSNANIEDPKASPAATTVYTVTVTDGNSCTQIDSMTVTVNPLPPADAGLDTAICIGGTANLTATGGTGYAWSTGAGTASISVSPLVTTTYTVTVTDGNSCTAIDSVEVTVNPLPTVDAGPTQTICDGDTVQIGGSPTGPVGSTYSWSSGASLDDASASNPLAFPTSTTEYFVTVIDVNTCENIDSVTVNVNTLPPADAGPNRTICLNDSAQLNASGGINYAWSPAASLSNGSIADPKAGPAATTIYTVTVTDGNSCSQTDTMTVTVNPLPPADAGADVEICIGGSTQLNASGGIAYAWSPGTALTSTNVADPIANPTDTITYTVTVTDANTCSATDQVTVTVNPLPIVDPGMDLTICNEDTIQIGGAPTGPAGSTYSWTPAGTLVDGAVANPMAFPSDTQQYVVVVTDTNTCVNSDSMTVNVNQLPTADAGTDVEICVGDSIQLTATGGVGYSWTPTAGLSNPNIANPMASPSDTTDYEVVVTDVNSCIDTDTVRVTVNPLPAANAGLDLEMCIGDSIQITATGGDTYVWSPATGLSSTTIANPMSGALDTITYTVLVTDSNSCQQVDSMVLTVEPLPIVDAGLDLTICNEDTIQIGGAPTGPAGSTYSWTPAGTLVDGTVANPLAFPSDTQQYVVVVTDTNTCVNSDSMTVNVNQLPTADAGTDVEICIGDSIQLTATGGVGYSWTPTAGLSNPNIANPMASPSDTTDYEVVVTDVNSCIDTDTVRVTVNPLPAANAGLDLEMCIGDSIQITATGGDTYVWSPATGLSSTTIANPMSGALDTITYTVLVTDSNSCQQVDSMVLTVEPLPIVDAGLDLTICNEDTIQIGGAPTGPAGSTYSWTPAGTLVDGTAANPMAFPSDTQQYVVVVTDTNTCVNSDSMTVNVNQLPTADAGTDVEICIGDSIQLTATGGVGYSWTPTAGLSNPNIANPMASPSDTTDYEVVVTDVNSCIDTDTVRVTVNPLPAANAGLDLEMCIGDSIQITATGGDTYVWSPATGLSSTTIANPMSGALDTITYTVLVTDSNSCQQVDSMVLTVEPLPVVSAGPDLQICIGQSIVIGGSPTGPVGSTYLWMPADSLDDVLVANPTANPTDTTTYTVQVTDTNTCVNTDAMVLSVNPLPNIDAGVDTTAICIYDTIQLNATGGADYVWQPSATLDSDTVANPNAFPLVSTTYVVTGTDSNTCVNVDSIHIHVDTLPIISAGPDLWLCPGFDIQLGATGAQSYVWSPGAELNDSTIAAPVAVLIDTNTFVITGTDVNGCVNTDTMTVIVNPVVPTDAGSDREICLLDSTMLGGPVTAPPNTIYSWTPNVGLASDTSANPMASPFDTTLYIVNTLNDTCTGADTVLVIVNPLPMANAGLDAEICIFDSLQLVATGGADYVWTPATGLSNDSIANPLASPDTTTQYVVLVTDSNTCQQVDTMVLTVHPLPIVDAGLDTAICIFDTIQIAATGGADYVWTPATGLSNDSIANPLANPLATTTYSVQVTDSNTCVNFDSVTVTVNPLPIADAGVDQEICIGDTTQLGATGGELYAWTPSTALSDTAVSDPLAWPGDTIVYTVLVTDSNTCKQVDSMTIVVNPLPNADAGLNDEICIGDSIQLEASGGEVYLWNADPALNNINIADPFANPIDTTWFVVTVTDSNMCVNVDSVRIDVNQLPNAFAGVDTNVCYGDSIMLMASGGEQYTWTPAVGLSDSAIFNPFAFPDVPTTYTVEVVDSNMCVKSDDVYVHVFRIVAEGDTSFCEHDVVELNVTTNGTPVSYAWDPIDGLEDPAIQSPNVTIDIAGSYIYTVTVTDNMGCTDTDDVMLEVYTDPVATFDVVYTPLCTGVEVQFDNMSSDASSYEWDFGDGATSTDEFPDHLFDFSTTHPVTLVASNMYCTDTTVYTVGLYTFEDYLNVEIPNVFSPNNDGINDVFTIQVNPGVDACAELLIFNRWGSQIFSTPDGVPAWDGTNSFTGGNVPQGTYFYTYTVGDFQINGSVTLYR